MSDLSPTLEEFRKLAVERRVIPVYRRLLADADTAIGLYRKLARNRPGTYLLESAEQGVWSRYSFVGVRAAATLTEHDGEAVWSGHAPVGLPVGGDPLAAVGETLRLLHTPRGEDLPPFTSGLVGYLSYDAVRRIERLPDTCVDDLRIPELTFLLASDLAVLDHRNGEVWLVANAINFDNTDERVDEAYADAADRVEAMTELLTESTPAGVVSASFDQTALPIRRQRAPEDYQRAVRSAVEEIKAGEAFQIVVSQRFEVDTTADALDIYRVLRLTNPSPYMYLLRLDDFDIVGSSPEALVSVKGTTAVTHPIAGSKPRGGTPAEDAALETELLADPKERAEHVMLVDLGRNDLGRVCQPGTVEVVEFMEVRRYSHIMHLESTVTGTIPRTAPRSTSSWRPSRLARCPARRRSAPWRSLTSLRSRDGDSTAAWWAIWTLPVMRMRRSPSGRRWCVTAWLLYKPVGGSWRTPTRPPRIRRLRTRPLLS